MNCEQVVKRYVEALKGEFYCVNIEGWIKVITPYLYPDNDNIEIFVKEISQNTIRTTDFGETLRHLHSQAFDAYSTPKRKFLLETLISRSNLSLKDGEIYKDCAPHELGEAIFDIIMACKAIGDLIFTSRAYEPALFLDEVTAFLKERKVKFEPKVAVKGSTGRTYKVDFRILNRKISYLHTLSPAGRGGIKPKVDATFRMWFDVDTQMQKLSLLNDIDFAWSEPDVLLLSRVSKVVSWSKREEIFGFI